MSQRGQNLGFPLKSAQAIGIPGEFVRQDLYRHFTLSFRLA